MEINISPEIMQSKGIYKIVAPSGSCYVGMTTVSFDSRWSGHLKELRNGRHKCLGLKRAYKKYGEAALSFEILEKMPSAQETDILSREQFWWDELKAQNVNLYNGRPSGTGSVIHTAETKEKISETMKAYYSTKSNNKITILCKNCGIEFERKSNKVLENSCCSLTCSSQLKSFAYDDVEIIRLYVEEELSTWIIAEKLGLKQQNVLSHLTKAGIPRRSSASYTKKRVSYSKLCLVCNNGYEASSHKSKTCSRSCRGRLPYMHL